MNNSVAKIDTKKVTVTVETKDGMTYVYNLDGGDDASTLRAQIEVNTQYETARAGFWDTPIARHPVNREFRLVVNY